jgi:hypothetical protein
MILTEGEGEAAVPTVSFHHGVSWVVNLCFRLLISPWAQCVYAKHKHGYIRSVDELLFQVIAGRNPAPCRPQKMTLEGVCYQYSAKTISGRFRE